MKFCPECGVELPSINPKLCPECGARLRSPSASNVGVSEETGNSGQRINESSEKEEPLQIKLKTYELGVNLEDMTAAIFQRMGYSVEKRKREFRPSVAQLRRLTSWPDEEPE